MQIWKAAIAVFLSAGLLVSALQAVEPAFVFTGVNVVPMDRERVMPNLNVVVQDGRITSIFEGTAGRPPANAAVINGSGKYLMAGLAEMHGHIPPPNQPQQWIEDVLFMYVANGVTTVRGMLGSEGQLALREKAATGAIISPTLYLAGPSFNANAPKSEAEAVQMVRAQKAAGWDLLKVHPGRRFPSTTPWRGRRRKSAFASAATSRRKSVCFMQFRRDRKHSITSMVTSSISTARPARSTLQN